MIFVHDIINILLPTCVSRAEPGDAAWRAVCRPSHCDFAITLWPPGMGSWSFSFIMLVLEFLWYGNPSLCLIATVVAFLVFRFVAVSCCVCRGSRVLRIYPKTSWTSRTSSPLPVSLDCMLVGRTSFVLMWEYRLHLYPLRQYWFACTWAAVCQFVASLASARH